MESQLKLLLQISIGPVQPFIAASRKARDLAEGSSLLSDLGKAVAEVVQKAKAQLIFPADPKHGAANIILALLPEGADPKVIAQDAKIAIQNHLAHQWTVAAKELHGEVDEVRAKAQLADSVEFYAVWTPMEGEDYAKAWHRVGALMAARKSTRMFAQPQGQAGLPKSALAPDRETVLKTEEKTLKISPTLQKRVPRLKHREHLDAINVIKRFANVHPTPSTREIAVLDHLRLDQEGWKTAQEKLKDSDLDPGDILFGLDDREWNEVQANSKEVRVYLEEWRNNVLGPKENRRPLRPYYAIIQADGDGMGAKLGDLAKSGIAKHIEFSRNLTAFASEAKRIVEENDGHLIYAGGDDVLAFTVAHQAIAIADKLRQEFFSKTGGTLSVGVAICNVMEDLATAREFALKLEREAKKVEAKNALAVGVRVRSGSTRTFASSWDQDPAATMAHLVEQFQAKAISRAFPYEVRSLADELLALESAQGKGTLNDLPRKELARLWKRKQGRPSEDLIENIETAEHLSHFADQLLIAHFMTREGASEN